MTSADEPPFKELFTPKLVTVWREGYGLADLRADAIAGLTVAIVALPLSMAIAVAAGTTPGHGLTAAIVGGFFVSLFGGSRFQIGGPAGAFIVLLNLTLARHGYEGLVLATALAGLMLLAIGLLRLGTYVKYIPYPVTVGFTAGIAVIIFASQVKDLLGLALADEPPALLPKIAALVAAIGSVNWATVAVAAMAMAVILALRSYRPKWPSLLIAVALAAVLVAGLRLDVVTIGSRFGDIPHGLPAPSLPVLPLAKVWAILPDALAIAVLGAIESLLSAVVADGMTGRRHRSNCELVAQGIANMGSALFQGLAVTGTIARTATNIRAGARGPIAGMFHSAYLLAFMLVAAPLVSYIPLAALAAILAIVAWDMAEKRDFWLLLRSSWGDATVLVATFLLTIFHDLMVGIAVGVALGSFVFLRRMEEAIEIEAGPGPKLISEDVSDRHGARVRYDAALSVNADVMVVRISGAFFFAATSRIGGTLDRIGSHPRVLVFDFTDVPIIDSTGTRMLFGFVRKLQRAGTEVYFAGVRRSVRRALLNAGLRRPLVRYADSVESVRNMAKTAGAEDTAAGAPSPLPEAH